MVELKGIEPSNLSVQVKVPSQYGLSPIYFVEKIGFEPMSMGFHTHCSTLRFINTNPMFLCTLLHKIL